MYENSYLNLGYIIPELLYEIVHQLSMTQLRRYVTMTAVLY